MTSTSQTSFSLSDMPPLPPLPPPPPPSTTPPSSVSSEVNGMSATSTTTAYSSTFNMAANAAMYNPAYYQQYMQYYQYMMAQQQQLNPQAAAAAAMAAASYTNTQTVTTPVQQQTAQSGSTSASTVSSPLKNFFTYKPPKQPQSQNNFDSAAQKQGSSNNLANGQPNKPPIKFNLKFQQFPKSEQQQEQNDDANDASESVKPAQNGRKSRFDNLNNVTNQQKEFEQQQASSATANKPLNTTSGEQQTNNGSAEIVSNINKWPTSLKNFCAKVYQHYQTITTVTEDQVTKYLQQRITDAFKIKSNLETGWETETMPSVDDIKKVAPLSNAQQQQLKHQANLNIKKMNAARAAIQFKKQQQEPNCFNYNTLNKNKSPITPQTQVDSESPSKKEKRKKKSRSSSSSTSRSRSSSSSSSSSSTTTTKSSNTSKSSLDSSFNPNKKGKKGNNEFTPKSTDANVLQNKFNNKRKLVPFDVKFDKQVSSHDGSVNSDAMDQSSSSNNGQFLNNFNSFNNYNNGGVKLTKKQRKNQAKLSKRMQQQQQQQQRFLNATTTSNTNPDKILLSRKTFNNQQQQQFTKVFKSRASFKSIFDLAKDQYDMMDIDNEDKEHKKIWCIGTNQDYEKEYLRLTGPPEPHMIRPLPVLKQSLQYILSKYKRTNDYRYICDQLKAIRQDLTVQMIQNEFTIQVYETHARIALENKDRDEFNQCQNQLKNLYNLVYKPSSSGSSSPTSKTMTETNIAEFIGYRLIYNILTKSYKDINEVTKEIKLLYPSNTYLKHLLELKNAWHLNNYIKFFRLYLLSNHLTKCLIDLFIERERKNALKIIIKSYRPSIKLESVCEMLAYESLEKCKEDLLAYKLNIQTVSSSSNTAEANNSSLTKPNNSIKSTSSNKTQPTATVFELILDCKSCSIQNL